MKRTHRENLTRVLIVFGVMTVLIIAGIRNSPEYVHNPDNEPFRLECAWNLEIEELEVTQLQFKERYLK